MGKKNDGPPSITLADPELQEHDYMDDVALLYDRRKGECKCPPTVNTEAQGNKDLVDRQDVDACVSCEARGVLNALRTVAEKLEGE